MFGLEKHKNLFGAPRTGVHSIRIFDIAVVDLVLTLILAWIIAYMVNKNFFVILVYLFILSIVIHRLFGVRTKVDTLLFGK